MKKYLAALMTGILLLGSSLSLFADTGPVKAKTVEPTQSEQAKYDKEQESKEKAEDERKKAAGKKKKEEVKEQEPR
ncbi:MAG: hypothetical protein ACHQYQ_07695 [Bacteriovoracales bacterium]